MAREIGLLCFLTSRLMAYGHERGREERGRRRKENYFICYQLPSNIDKGEIIAR